jgi:nucleoside-diphosphate-sugar epimerase
MKDVGHDWAYLPDAGEVFAQLMDRVDELADFERFHFQGHWDADGTEMITAIRKVVGQPSLPVKPLPWFIFKSRLLRCKPLSKRLFGAWAVLGRPSWRLGKQE